MSFLTEVDLCRSSQRRVEPLAKILSLGGDGPPYLKRGKLIMTTAKEAAIELTDEELNLITAAGDLGACVAACTEKNKCETNACVDKCVTQCLKE